ncbi:MAG: hypothetical protein GY848_17500, partial [Methyloversatilis sp.]|nr:hypothetical protein [Methyloversatilis sp.]
MADDYPSVDRVMGGPAGWISIAFPTILFLYFLGLLIALYCSSMLVWRDRTMRVHEIIDALP